MQLLISFAVHAMTIHTDTREHTLDEETSSVHHYFVIQSYSMRNKYVYPIPFISCFDKMETLAAGQNQQWIQTSIRTDSTCISMKTHIFHSKKSRRIVGVHVWLFVPLTLRYIILHEKLIHFSAMINVWVNILSDIRKIWNTQTLSNLVLTW